MSIDLSGYDPADPEAQQNPFPHYARLRRDNPVFLHPELQVYFVARYDTVREVLADPHTYSSKLSNAASMPSDPQTLVKLARP